MEVTRPTAPHPRRRVPIIRLAVAAAAAAALGTAGGAVALDGPVVLGGDGFPKHGGFGIGTGALTDGWFAMDRSLRYVAPKVGRYNDNGVAAIGARASAATADDAGAAIGRAAAASGMTVTYVDGADAINAYFASLQSGAVKPRVLWIAGNSAVNSLDTAEIAAVNANAARISSYVAGGGGLIAHGDETVYGGGWLQALIPGIEAYCCGGSSLQMTPAGAVALPGLTDPTVSVGAWRNAFRGNLGGLVPFIEAPNRFEDSPADTIPQKVVIGGGRAWATPTPADIRVSGTGPAVVDRGDTFVYRFAVTNRGPGLAGGVRLTDALPTGFAFRGAAATQGACTGGRTTVCALGDIGVGATARVTIFAKALRQGRRTNNTVVRAATPDPTPGNRHVARVTRALTTRLSVNVVVPDSAETGGVVKVRLSVRNTGGRAAKGVILRSPTIPGFALEERPAGARVERGAAIWELGNVAPGRTRVAVFRLRAGSATRGVHCIPGLARARNADFTSARGCLPVR